MWARRPPTPCTATTCSPSHSPSLELTIDELKDVKSYTMALQLVVVLVCLSHVWRSSRDTSKMMITITNIINNPTFFVGMLVQD